MSLIPSIKILSICITLTVCVIGEISTTPVELKRQNIEIKARVANDAAFEKRIEIAKTLTSTAGQVLEQHDVFYKVSNGRLKLRVEVSNYS